MNVYKQNRSLKITIALLIIFNLATLFLLWLGNPARQSDNNDPVRVEQDNERIEQLLKDELGFNDTQAKNFIKLRYTHLKEAGKIENDIRNYKRQMFDRVLMEANSQALSDSLLTLSLNRQADLERLTYNYVVKLKELCTPGQTDKLMMIMHKLLPPPKGPQDGPPPPGGKKPPKRN